MKSITSHLLSLETNPPYSLATQSHNFLEAAGDGSLSNTRLSLFLSQDRIYAAHAYPRFIGTLIANIPFGQPHMETKMAERILKILVYSLGNIVREVDFFDNTAKSWGLDLDGWQERKGTRNYTAEMARISNSGRLEEGILFLWAMEKVYWDAWTSVHDRLKLKDGSTDLINDSPVFALAKNWSSPEFKIFVDDLAQLADDVYVSLGENAWSVAEGIWNRVIELEEEFWPRDGEEIVTKIYHVETKM